MATRFEFVLCGEDEISLRAAGEEAIREIKRIENKLSFYQRNSIISQINARAGHEPVKVDSETFSFMENVSFLSRKTEGAFDPTVAPLMKVWGFIKNSGSIPDGDQIRKILQYTGTHLIELDKEKQTIRFKKQGVSFDPGAVGKGYALDQAACLLKENGVEHALLHGGTSTVVAWGVSPGQGDWNVAVKHPVKEKSRDDEITEVFALNDQALSVSAVWGKAIELDGKTLGHVIDPRTGYPAETALLAACVADNATTADACSTAMLVLNTQAPDFVSAFGEISSYFLLLHDGKTISGNAQI
jgi:FAD:protein FMN transferase